MYPHKERADRSMMFQRRFPLHVYERQIAHRRFMNARGRQVPFDSRAFKTNISIFVYSLYTPRDLNLCGNAYHVFKWSKCFYLDSRDIRVRDRERAICIIRFRVKTRMREYYLSSNFSIYTVTFESSCNRGAESLNKPRRTFVYLYSYSGKFARARKSEQNYPALI